MTTKRSFVKAWTGAALAGVLFVSGAAMAHPGRELTPEQRVAKIDQRVHERLAPKLGLDEQATAKLSEILRSAAQKRIAARQAVRRESEALQALVERKAPAAELEAQMQRLQAARQAMPPAGEVLAQTKGILNAEQQARLTLILERRGHHGHRGGEPT